MANLAALRAAVCFSSLSAKNLRGADNRRPRPRAGYVNYDNMTLTITMNFLSHSIEIALTPAPEAGKLRRT